MRKTADQLAVEYPSIDTLMAAKFDYMRDREDDGAIIAAYAAVQFQDHPIWHGNVAYHARLALEAWSDAINGGIVIC